MLERVVSQATYYVAGICAFILTNLNEIAVFIGIVCTVVTTVINWYYKCREDARYDRQK